MPGTRRDPLGTVELLPSGRYRASYRHGGRKYSAPYTFPTKSAARDWLASERADRARGVWHDPRRTTVTLSEYAMGWLTSRTDLADRTRRLYRDALNLRILPKVGAPEVGYAELGRLPLDQITPLHVRTWFAAMSTHAAGTVPTRREYPSRAGGHGQHPARTWAMAHDLPVRTTGRLSPQILAAWTAAGCPRPTTGRRTATGRTAAAQAYRCLHTVLSAAVTDGLISSNPATVKGAGICHHLERETATPDEVAQLAAHMPEPLACAVWLAAWSGLRQGELFALARRHIDIDAGTVRVERAVDRSGRFTRPKTAHSVRTVALPQFVTDRLAAHLDQFTHTDPDALVFATSAGNPIPAARLYQAFHAARHAIGREGLTWHDLRHTGATLAYAAGGSVRDVQNRLGHATARAAMIYAHTADDSDKRLAQRLQDTYGDAWTQPDPTTPATPPRTTRPRPVGIEPAAGPTPPARRRHGSSSAPTARPDRPRLYLVDPTRARPA